MTGYVYFFESGGMVKIGKANNVHSRFNQLKTGCPTGLKKLGAIRTSDPFKLEGEVHLLYKHYRRNGEWFELPHDIKSDIVHNVRFRLDDRYREEYLKNEKEAEIKEYGYWESEVNSDLGQSVCPSCECEHFHLKGVYKRIEKKYISIITLVECEYHDHLYGHIERFGKGSKGVSTVLVSRIPTDWEPLNETIK